MDNDIKSIPKLPDFLKFGARMIRDCLIILNW